VIKVSSEQVHTRSASLGYLSSPCVEEEATAPRPQSSSGPPSARDERLCCPGKQELQTRQRQRAKANLIPAMEYASEHRRIMRRKMTGAVHIDNEGDDAELVREYEAQKQDFRDDRPDGFARKRKRDKRSFGGGRIRMIGRGRRLRSCSRRSRRVARGRSTKQQRSNGVVQLPINCFVPWSMLRRFASCRCAKPGRQAVEEAEAAPRGSRSDSVAAHA